MTDQKPNTPADAPKKKAAAKAANPPSASASKEAPRAKKTASSRGHHARSHTLALVILFVLLVAAVALGYYFWNASSQSIAQLQSQQQGALGQLEQSGQQASQQAAQALDALKKQESTLSKQADQIASLEQSLADTREALQDLSHAYQRLTDRGSDLVLLNDIENLVTIAQQQLQLSGNVANAIMSLETAQAQLARANRPTMASLQQTINGDLERLRAARVVDIASISSQLDDLAELVMQAPLLIPDDAAPQIESGLSVDEGSQDEAPVSNNPSEASNWWERALAQARSWAGQASHAIRSDIDRFVSVRRVDDATALFISPDQASQFRDHLRMRVMTAQMALVIGRAQVWEAETTTLQQAMEGRFDEQSALSRKAIRLARELADTPIEVKLPTVDNSIRALESLRQSDATDEDEPQDNSDDDAAQAAG